MAVAVSVDLDLTLAVPVAGIDDAHPDVAAEEALEDSLAAELVDKDSHGMGFGVLAAVNGVGDFISSLAVGLLWASFGSGVAYGYSAILFAVGAFFIWRLR